MNTWLPLRGLAPLLFVVGCSTTDTVGLDGNATLHEELRLDANAENFSTLGRVIVGTRGEIILSLPQDVEVRVYDSTGKRLAAFGRKGDAPGEFQYIGQVGLKADSIWVMDAETRAITYYTPRGEMLRTGGLPGRLTQTTAYNGSSEYYFVMAAGVHPDGSMLASGRKRTPARPRGSHNEWLHLSQSGEIQSIAIPPSYEDPRWMMEIAGLGRSIPFMGTPLTSIATDASRIAWLVTNLTSADAGNYQLTVLRANGDTILVKEFPFQGTPIPQSAKDSAANAEIQTDGPSEGPSDIDQRFKRMALEKMPAVYAPVQSILLGMDDTIWLILRDSAGVRRAVALDERGEELGRVTLTTRQRIRQATRGTIWVTELDDADLASVVRYRVGGVK